MPPEPGTYESYFKRMSIPRCVIRIGPDARFTVEVINECGLHYFAQEEDFPPGAALDEVFGAEYSAHFSQAFEVCCQKKQAVSIQALPGVPGKIRVYGFYISPVLNEAGEVEYLDVIGQLDVADQSIVQRERDDAISLLTSIFEVSEVAILVTDKDGRIVRVNDSFIRSFGWSRPELINADVVGLVTPNDRDAARQNHDEFIKTGTRSAGEMKLIRKDGSVANALYTTATLELSQKRRFLVITIMDITLRKQMEESLRMAKDQADAANRAKSVFLANMSHELRTPLNAIIGFSEMMVKQTFGSLGSPKYQEYIQDVHSSARHLLEIINEVLDMSKIEAGRIELDESEIEISDMVSSALRMMEARAFDARIKLASEVKADAGRLVCDPRLMRQILINLLSNAVKFSPAQSEVKVGAEKTDDGRLQITVSDQGAGIPRDKIKLALEPFGQITERAENADHRGTGLGLPLARAMVELHHGMLEIDSDIGKGTRVVITMPSFRTVQGRQNASGTVVGVAR